MSVAGIVEDLRMGFGGQVVGPENEAYDRDRVVFNAMHDKRPAAIARCATTADVVSAIAFARQRGLVVAVRCGGHSVAGLSVCDDGLLIDLSGLKRISVDAKARTARAGGGVLWGEFDAATQAHALHTPGGRVTTTGVGGFTTGGGYGWTSSKYGLTCDNLLSAEVELADGRVVTASECEHPDLFWGLRGGGGNFGIVTEFEYRLHPVGPMVLAGMMLWPVNQARDILRAWRHYADQAPDEVSTAFAIITAPPEPFIPESLRGQLVCGAVFMYVGDPDAGLPFLAPLRSLGAAVDLVQPMPYTVFQGMLDGSAPKGFRSYWRGEYLQNLSDAAIEVSAELGPRLAAAAPPFTQMVYFRIGQGVTAVREDATAFSHRDANYLFHPIVVWQEPSDDARCIAASRALCEAMRPFATGGAYLNFTPEDRVRDAYGASKYEKLVALKDRYDPGNLFCLNQNIKPSRR
jgi:FAD/FMN-containing dehydrogenase